MNISLEPIPADPFADSIKQLDEYTDLARPALMLAADEYPNLNFDRYLAKLDDLADEALQCVIIDAESECEAARRLALFLAEKRGFRGSEDNYYDPRNSFLNEVLDTGRGIPITLSLVLIEVGRRLGLPLVGIGLPGHFVVGCGPHRRREGDYLLLDQFCYGKIVELSECELRLQSLGLESDAAKYLTPVTNRQFFERMLSNLEAIYIKKRDVKRAMRATSRLVLFDPKRADSYLQFGATLASESRFEDSRRCLRAFLELRSEGTDADSARRLLQHLLDSRAMRN